MRRNRVQAARPELLAAIVAGAAFWAISAPLVAAEERSAWDDIVTDVFDGRAMEAGRIVALEAPSRAEDAALVPMTIRTELPPGDDRQVKRITLVIDENPAPVAATFEIGPGSGVSTIETRVRVNTYTPVHAVAELSDGSLHVTEAFVKASGGCSAPAIKDPEEAMAKLGKMRLRQFPATGGTEAPISTGMSEAQLMIRHPNNSGLQMDQLTRHYIPAHFVSDLTIRQGENLILRMEGGISLSEDPIFRFDFRPTGEPMRVEAVDTEGQAFRGEWMSGSPGGPS